VEKKNQRRGVNLTLGGNIKVKKWAVKFTKKTENTTDNKRNRDSRGGSHGLKKLNRIPSPEEKVKRQGTSWGESAGKKRNRHRRHKCTVTEERQGGGLGAAIAREEKRGSRISNSITGGFLGGGR